MADGKKTDVFNYNGLILPLASIEGGREIYRLADGSFELCFCPENNMILYVMEKNP